MPGREESLTNGNIYHIFNKSIESKKVFGLAGDCNRFLQSINYYRSVKASIRFSNLDKLAPEIQRRILINISLKKYFQVETLCYCLMPTHFHFLLKQKRDTGISKFISDSLNSFTRYYNLKNGRKGPIFLPRFKAVKVRSENQLIHVSRYIHLQPYSAELITNKTNLLSYPWSSFKEYLFWSRKSLSSPDYILKIFGNNRQRYKKFVLSHADYQKTLEYVKHLEKWK